MLGAQPYYEPLTTQQIDEEKKKIKTLTDLKNDVLIDVNNLPTPIPFRHRFIVALFLFIDLE